MTPHDKILLRRMRLSAIIGVDEWEQRTPQQIVVDVVAFVDTRRAGASDDLADSLDYRALADSIAAYVERSRHLLVESLAAAIARIVVVEHGAVRAQVRIEKPNALERADSVGVEIDRERADFA